MFHHIPQGQADCLGRIPARLPGHAFRRDGNTRGRPGSQYLRWSPMICPMRPRIFVMP